MTHVPANTDPDRNRILVAASMDNLKPDSLMPYQHLNRTDDGVVTTVTLARPDSHNALNVGLIEELTQLFRGDLRRR